MRILRHLIAAIAAALIVTGGAARADTEKASVAFPAIVPIFASLYVAQDAGIYKDVGLEVTEQVIQGIGSANAVISGSVDFSSSSGVTLTRAVARQQPVIGIGNTYDRSGFWIIIKKSIADQRHFDAKAPLAERAKLMKGLRIAIGGFQAIPDAYAKAIAHIGGLDPDSDFVRAAIGPQDTLGAMKSGNIDGASIGPPVLQQLEANDFAVVIANGTTANPTDPPWLSPIAANVIFVRKQTCTERRSLCAKMGEAMVKAAAYVHNNPNGTKKIIAQRLKLTDPTVIEDTYRIVVAGTSLQPTLDAKQLEAADRLNIEAGFMPASAALKSYDNIFTNEFVK
jgi:ABC-type nitrate/sulfonate/bicarbonate transport system substrate-binding protein